MTEALRAQESRAGRGERAAAYVALLIVATAGLAFELALGASESLLLGDPVVHFALVIGLYMTALGGGAWATGWVRENVEAWCAYSLLATAVLGGLSGAGLLAVFVWGGPFKAALYAWTIALGVLVGMQLPLMMRILKRTERFEEVVARSFALDYAGALAGSLAFSLVMMPRLGLVRATVVLGLLEAVAAWFVARHEGNAPGARGRRVAAVITSLALVALIALAARIEAAWEPLL